MRQLSSSEREAIRGRVRNLLFRDLSKPIPTNRRILCHNCGRNMPAAGSVSYGRYRLCNDCAFSLEIALAEEKARDIEDFLLTD